MSFRKVLFWAHLASGVVAGLIILLMCVTGVLLTYERQIISWSDRSGISITPGGTRLPIEGMLASVAEKRPSAVALFSDTSRPAEVAVEGATVFVNPYSGVVLGQSSTDTPTRRFFRSMRDWHRWIGMNGENRDRARSIADAGNLIFFFIVLSGLYLWFPRKMTWQHFRPVILFRGGLKSKARDFNWHNVIGVWSWVPLVLVVGTGVIISYQWASNLLYTMTGSPVPVVQAKGKDGKQKAAKGKEGGGEGREGGRRQEREARPVDFAGLNAAWAHAEQQVPGWASIRLQFPGNPNAPLSFAIDRGDGGQPHLRSTLVLNRATAEVQTFTSFADSSTGQRLRQLARFTHTGESAGIIGQTIAGLATLGGAVLVFTGIALAIRRYFAWIYRKPAKGVVPAPIEEDTKTAAAAR